MFPMLLVLNLVPREVECTEHRVHEAEAVAAAIPAEGATQALEHDHGPADQPTPCESSDKSDCCQAMDSCSSSSAIRAAHASESAPATYRSIPDFGARAPAYLIRPPEPPPPKA
jgi:hypothetical protein